MRLYVSHTLNFVLEYLDTVCVLKRTFFLKMWSHIFKDSERFFVVAV